MPDQISVSEFVAETHEDYKAPTASSFTTRTAQCRNTVAAIEEVSGAAGPCRAGGSGPRRPRGPTPGPPAAGPPRLGPRSRIPGKVSFPQNRARRG